MASDLKLGLNIGYWAGGPPPGAQEAIQEADRLGFDSVWSAEAYGSDALMPLAWWGAATDNIKLGTAIVQISARTPAATAMADSSRICLLTSLPYPTVRCWMGAASSFCGWSRTVTGRAAPRSRAPMWSLAGRWIATS